MTSSASVLAVGFWCSASNRSWSWTPRPYLGAWVIVAGVLGLAAWWATRGRQRDALVAARAGTVASPSVAEETAGVGPINATTTPAPSTGTEGSNRTRTIALVLGALGLWACLDWPLATLGAGYLVTAQMIRQVLMVMVVAPLLLFATPAPLAARLVGWGKRLTVLRWTARPIVAVPVAAGLLVAVNAPAVVDVLLRTPFGAFAMDGAWTLAGFMLWMPVQCPHPGVRRLRGPLALMYLIGQSIVPVIPGFFMTWADFPLYRTFELAPRAITGFGAVADQQTAAAVLQVGGMVLLWLQISYRFLHWANQQMEEAHPTRRTAAAQSVPPTTPAAS